ncbi:Permease of the drug/metabolite transporter (DMT) superfamily [Noviherbaspirillum humi]|uniref:Permease of the drug/metabolite transporter (DMT) superfamily n=1 Tax=Noviherbaspirillum humi TaxID=1688639 RepID=A0A239HT52_9BURK|nr:DMT family transporter [Noviherbaspirillum humi]SNS84401.1 Permease of the drug/metabolite transporter (DMT) superfamily [Noviherbaspirillum humi]
MQSRTESRLSPSSHASASHAVKISPLTGIAFITASVACFAALDTTTKVVGMSASLAMVLWFRYVFQLGFTLLTVLPQHGLRLPRSRRPGLQVLRGILLLMCSVLAFLSLKLMPVGEFTAIILLAPLFITVVAATRLRQRISPLRWLLLFAGFGGALLVVRPDAHGLSWNVILPLMLVAANVGYQLLTSELARSDDAATMQFLSGAVGAAITTCALPFFWQMPDGRTWMLFLTLGVFSTLGHLLLIHGYKKAPVGLLTPFLYMQIGFAMLAGWIVFSHVPDSLALCGVGVIAMAGMAGTWVASREQRRVRA